MGDWTEGYITPTNMHRGHKKLAMTCPGFASFAEAKVVKSPKYLVGPVLIFSMSPTSFSAFHVLAVCTLHFMRPQRLAVNTFNFCPICDLLCSNFWQRCQQTSTSRLFCNFPVFCTRAAIQILQHQKVCLRGAASILLVAIFINAPHASLGSQNIISVSVMFVFLFVLYLIVYVFA